MITAEELRFEDIVSLQSTSAVYKMVHERLGALALKVVACNDGPTLFAEGELLQHVHRAAPQLDAVPAFVTFFPSVLTSCNVHPTEQPQKAVLVMTFFKAAPLHKMFFTSKSGLTLAVSARILREVLLILEALHGINIVFVDVKLPNILIGIDGRVRLVDFGSAVLLHNDGESNSPDETEDSSNDRALRCYDRVLFLRGTPHVLPPELRCSAHQEEKLSRAEAFTIDLWACGACLVEMLTGELFSLEFWQDRVDACPIESPCKVLVKDFLKKLLEADPARRLGTPRLALEEKWLAHHAMDPLPFSEEFLEEVDMQTLGL